MVILIACGFLIVALSEFSEMAKTTREAAELAAAIEKGKLADAEFDAREAAKVSRCVARLHTLNVKRAANKQSVVTNLAEYIATLPQQERDSIAMNGESFNPFVQETINYLSKKGSS